MRDGDDDVAEKRHGAVLDLERERRLGRRLPERLQRLEGEGDVARVVDVVVGVEVAVGHAHLGAACAVTRGDEASRERAHRERGLVGEVDQLVLRDARGAPEARVVDEPLRVGAHDERAGGLHLEVPERVGARHLVAPRGHRDVLAKAGQAVDLDAPVGEDPCQPASLEPVYAQAHARGLEGRAVLKVVHQREERQASRLVALAVSYASLE